MRWVLAALVGATLVVSTLELSCVAEEWLAASPVTSGRRPSGAGAPERPGVPEAGGVESHSPTYTW